eukprot:8565517-Pyramimonas_sp.AAC.1
MTGLPPSVGYLPLFVLQALLLEACAGAFNRHHQLARARAYGLKFDPECDDPREVARRSEDVRNRLITKARVGDLGRFGRPTADYERARGLPTWATSTGAARTRVDGRRRRTPR